MANRINPYLTFNMGNILNHQNNITTKKMRMEYLEQFLSWPSGKTSSGVSGQAWRGVDVATRGKSGMHWLKNPQALEKLDSEGKNILELRRNS